METRERETKYYFIKEVMDKIQLTCPPIEEFSNRRLERWFIVYNRIDTWLEDLNNEHWYMLESSKEKKEKANGET